MVEHTGCTVLAPCYDYRQAQLVQQLAWGAAYLPAPATMHDDAAGVWAHDVEASSESDPPLGYSCPCPPQKPRVHCIEDLTEEGADKVSEAFLGIIDLLEPMDPFVDDTERRLPLPCIAAVTAREDSMRKPSEFATRVWEAMCSVNEFGVRIVMFPVCNACRREMVYITPDTTQREILVMKMYDLLTWTNVDGVYSVQAPAHAMRNYGVRRRVATCIVDRPKPLVCDPCRRLGHVYV